MKNHLKSRNFRLLWKLANIVNHLKKMCDLFFLPLFSQISHFKSLHHLSSINSENTNHRDLQLTGGDHCYCRLSGNIHFYRNKHSFQNYIFFSKSKVSLLQSSFEWILYFLWCPSFLHVKTAHVCRLLHNYFSNIILHKRVIG